MKRWHKILLWVLGVALAGLIGIFAFGRHLLREFDENALKLGRPVLHDPAAAGQPNAADIYFKAGSLQPLKKEESAKIEAALHKPWSDPDGSLAAALELNRPGMEMLRSASRLPHCDFLGKDITQRNLNTAVPQYGGMIHLTRLVLLAGRRAESAGQPEQALDNYLTALNVAAHCRLGMNGFLIAQLVPRLMVDDSYEALGSLLGQGRLPPSAYPLLRGALLRLEDGGAVLARVINEDRGMFTDYQSLKLEQLLSYTFRGIREMMVTSYRRVEQDLDGAIAAAIEKTDPKLYDDKLKQLVQQHPGSSFISCCRHLASFGECFITTPDGGPSLTQYHKLIFPARIADAKIRVLLAATVIKMYEMARGSAPNNLSELVPAFLERVPQDPFNANAPLRYGADARSWKVYSLGPNRRDEGGAVTYAAQDADWEKPAEGDIVLSYPRVKPPVAPKRRRSTRR